MIEIVQEGDAAFLAQAEARIFSDAWSESAVRSHLAGGFTKTLTARLDGRAVGYLLGSLIPPEGEVYRIAVLPEYRRLGVAEALLSAFLAMTPVCFLEVRLSNAPARALYEKHGFRLIDRRKRYYKDPPEDACIYKYEETP